MSVGKFYIVTFGCQMNVLDSEKVAGLLVARGWIKTDSPQEADFILFNTCSVREKAARKVYSHLGTLRGLKRTKPKLVLAVMGCVAQQEGERMLKAEQELDLVVGTQRWPRIPDHVEAIRSGKIRKMVDTVMDNDPKPMEVLDALREIPFRAYVTIMEGCDNFCAYCVVPFTRGRQRSRPSANVIREVRELVAKGVVEVMLLGQNVNSYCDPSPAGMDFPSLLRATAGVPGLQRLRFTTSHPKDFNQALLQVMIEEETVCRQLHLPVQAGSTKILAAMNRRYTREDYLTTVDLIRGATRGISLSSDFIVGFPGETDADFQQTLSLLDYVRYDSIFSFCYSPRPLTKALEIADDVPEVVKKERLQALQARQAEIQLTTHRSLVGHVYRVLVDGHGREGGQLTSRTEENRIVHFIGAPTLIGNFVDVRITGFSTYTLQGERCL